MEVTIHSWLEAWTNTTLADRWSVWITVLCIVLIAYLSYELFRHVLIPITQYITKKTETDWDDDLLNPKVLKAVSQLVPAIIVAVLLPDNLHMGKLVYRWSVKGTDLYILWASVNLIMVFLRGVQSSLDRRHMLREHNLEILRQTVVLFIIIIASIIALGILINRDPLTILAGLGASAAVLMLVFRDTILNFVAGIQLTVNRMLVRGDWVIVPKAGANGEVTEVKLTTIKIKNWDNSIVTIPPYTLFTDSFQNFTHMRESGARRVSRSVFIDQSTIRFLSPEEISELNDTGLADEPEVNDKTVNLTLLRKYMERYLADYPTVLDADRGRPDLTLMVRQLQPTPQGLPMELYFFTSLTSWKPYEQLQSDVFDHFYAMIPRFHLRAYQAPSGADFTHQKN